MAHHSTVAGRKLRGPRREGILPSLCAARRTDIELAKGKRLRRLGKAECLPSEGPSFLLVPKSGVELTQSA